MNYNQFMTAVTKEMQEAVLEGESVTVHTVLKNNGIKMKALSVRKNGQDVCPLIYLAPFYRMHQCGRSIKEIVEEIKALYRMNGNGVIDRRIFFSYALAKPYLAYRIIQFDTNRELLCQVPHRKLLNFAVVYYLALEGQHGIRGSALIYQDHIRAWGVGERELHEMAFLNTPKILLPKVNTLDKAVEALFLPSQKLQKRKAAEKIFVISNEYNFFGAAAVFYPGVLKQLSEQLNSNLYLLPSSVHEFLALPYENKEQKQGLEQLVCSVNDTHVAPEDVLSDRIYRYEKESDRIFLE